MDAVMIGIIFARISHPKYRGRTIAISDSAVISRRDGVLKLMFRIADFRRTQVCCLNSIPNPTPDKGARCACILGAVEGASLVCPVPAWCCHTAQSLSETLAFIPGKHAITPPAGLLCQADSHTLQWRQLEWTAALPGRVNSC